MLVRPPSSTSAVVASRTQTAPPPLPPARAASASTAEAATALAAALAAVHLAAAPAPAFATEMPNSPLVAAKTQLVFGPTPDGSIRPCQGNIQPNCVSTASTNDLYSPPWTAPLTVAEAARVLERSVPAAEPSARLVQSADDIAGTGAAYRAWQADGVFGPDVFEVVIKPERGGGGGGGGIAAERGGESAASASASNTSALITYRSSGTSVKYVYPFQVALTDGGVQRKRATAVRAATNFSLVGCSDYECFIE